MLLSYKPLHLEAQQRLQEEGCVLDITRLVAKGYGQVQGIDYDETYSPVAMLKSVRIILAIAAYFDYEIWQMDVKTAFLHGNLTEDVYMIHPEGFVDPTSTSKVCKLKRSIYGLKQASRSWNIRFDEVVTDLGFIKSEEDSFLYKKLSGSSIVFFDLVCGRHTTDQK